MAFSHRRVLLLAPLLVLGLLVVSADTTAHAATRASKEKSTLTLSTTTEAVKNATVNIYCTFKQGRKVYSSTGSGVLIDTRGIVLTNAHVVIPYLALDKKGEPASTCTIRTGSPARAAYTASLLYVSPSWVEAHTEELREKNPGGTGEGDAALLYITEAIDGTLPSAFPALTMDVSPYLAVAEDEKVIAAGYPAGGKSFGHIQKKLKYLAAKPTVTSVRTYERPYTDMLVLSQSKAGSSGISGGPVTREDGSLIAIANSADTKNKEGNRILRAITLSHIDRFIQKDTGLPLFGLLISDLTVRSAVTHALLSKELRTYISNALLGKK